MLIFIPKLFDYLQLASMLGTAASLEASNVIGSDMFIIISFGGEGRPHCLIMTCV